MESWIRVQKYSGRFKVMPMNAMNKAMISSFCIVQDIQMPMWMEKPPHITEFKASDVSECHKVLNYVLQYLFWYHKTLKSFIDTK